MKKAFSLVAIIMLILASMLLSTTQHVTALAIPTPTPQSVYVDETRKDGNENGSTAYPYTDFEEGMAYAQSLDFGGRLYVRTTANGAFDDYGVYRGVTARGGGIVLPALTVYFLLGILALILILAGRRLQRRSRQLQNNR